MVWAAATTVKKHLPPSSGETSAKKRPSPTNCFEIVDQPHPTSRDGEGDGLALEGISRQHFFFVPDQMRNLVQVGQFSAF